MNNSNREKAAIEAQTLWRFNDLKLLGIVDDRATLRRWIATGGFPKAIILSPNSIAWHAAEVLEWLDNRPRGAAPQPSRSKKAA